MMPGDGLREHVRLGLALSGGGARGLAQVGVFQVLQREGIAVDLIAGSSIGAIIGGLYACWPDAQELQRRVVDFVQSEEMEGLNLGTIQRLGGVPLVDENDEGESRWGFVERVQRTVRRLYASHVALSRLSVLDGGKLLASLEEVFEGRTFDETKIPFAAVAVDLAAGREVVITTGSLARGVAASSAIPGIFPPVEIGGRMLVDGGYTSPVPISAVHALGANVVVAVDVSQSGIDAGRLENGVEVAMRASEISLIALEQEQLRRADVVIPARGQARHWSDFSNPEEAVAAGERAATNLMENIRAAIEERARLFI